MRCSKYPYAAIADGRSPRTSSHNRPQAGMARTPKLTFGVTSTRLSRSDLYWMILNDGESVWTMAISPEKLPYRQKASGVFLNKSGIRFKKSSLFIRQLVQ
jgi:hypothetical protein